MRWIAIALSLLVGAGAEAAPRHQKGATPLVEPVRSAALAARPRATERDRPALSADQLRAVSSQLGQLNERALSTLRRLLEVTPEGDPERTDLLFRLAELYREGAIAAGFRARELDEPLFRASAPRRRELEARQRRHVAEEQRLLRLAVEQYLRVAQTPAHQGYRRMDEVLFQLADLIQRSGRKEQARFFFQRLIRNHPQSRFLPDALLSFAEHAFEAGRIEEALRLYEQVARLPRSTLQGYALYKQGWCWLNLKDARRALELFVRVIQRPGGAEPGKLSLLREARRDAVRAYSLVGAPEQAYRFFVRIGGKEARRMLEQLAQLYLDQGKHAPAIASLQKLLALAPTGPDACRHQQAIVRATVASRPKRAQRDEARRLLAFARDRGAPGACGIAAAEVLRELATVWHREAQSTRDRATYDLAGELYADYLRSFPEAKDRGLMAYYHAELLFACERWAEAGEAYTRAVALAPRGAYLKEAVLAAAVSWQNALGVEDRSTPRGAERASKTPRPIPERERKLCAAFDLYLRHLPAGKEAPEIRYRRARILYEHDHHAEAAAGFAEVVRRHPEHPLAAYAANLLLDALNILDRHDELERQVRQLLASARLLAAHPELSAQLDTVMAGLERRRAERLANAGRHAEAAELYVRIANRRPDDPRWAELLHNAALAFEAAKRIGMAIAVRSTLIKGRPADPLAKRAHYLIGANYHRLAWYNRAAEHYERFALRYPGEREAPDALQNAIVFRLGRGELEQALGDARAFARFFAAQPRHAAQAAAVAFSLGRIHEERKDVDATIRHYADYLRSWGARGGVDRQARAHVAIGEALWRRSCPIPGLLGACVKRESARRSASEARAAGQCGPGHRTVIVERGPEARRAQQHFSAALALASRSAPTGDDEQSRRRVAELRQASAAARFHQAEALFEATLRIELPRDLSFSSRDRRQAARALRSFARYLEAKGRALAAATQAYREVITLREPHHAIAASARIGQLHQELADALYTAPVPQPPIPPALAGNAAARREFVELFRTQYCDGLGDKAGPLAEKAEQGLKACLHTARDLSWYNEWSRFCEAALHELKPAAYPLAAEIRAQPGYVSLRADRAGPITELR